MVPIPQNVDTTNESFYKKNHSKSPGAIKQRKLRPSLIQVVSGDKSWSYLLSGQHLE